MPHRRSTEAQQRRYARRLMLAASFRDPELAETVNQLSKIEVTTLLKQQFEGVFTGISDEHEAGEILIEARGRGSLQPTLPPATKLRKIKL